MTEIPISLQPGGETPGKKKLNSIISGKEFEQHSAATAFGSKLRTLTDRESIRMPPESRERVISDIPKPEGKAPEDEGISKRLKDDYIAKINYLRKAFPDAMIPEPENTQTAEDLVRMFNRYYKKIRVDSSVEQNKSILFVIWVVLELGFCSALRLPFSGYTKDQFRYLEKYQSLLIEFSESSISEDIAEEWHPFIRLLATILLNAVIFLCVNFAINKIE